MDPKAGICGAECGWWQHNSEPPRSAGAGIWFQILIIARNYSDSWNNSILFESLNSFSIGFDPFDLFWSDLIKKSNTWLHAGPNSLWLACIIPKNGFWRKIIFWLG